MKANFQDFAIRAYINKSSSILCCLFPELVYVEDLTL